MDKMKIEHNNSNIEINDAPKFGSVELKIINGEIKDVIKKSNHKPKELENNK